MQNKLNKKGRDHIARLASTVSDLWNRCCEHEGVEPDAPFVTFSKENPYQGFYNIAVKRLIEAKTEYAAGGYVGLRIVNGKAR